jgi:hypothetical protein
MVLLGITLGNDLAQAYLGLDPKGGYVLKLEPGKVQIDRNKQKPKLGFKHGLEVYKIPPDYLETPSVLQKFLDEAGPWLKKRNLLRRFFQAEEPITSLGRWNPPNLFDGTNGLAMFAQPPPPMIDEAYQRLFRVLTAFQTLCEARGILFVVEIFPQRFQVQPGDWERTVKHYSLKASRFDLMAPNQRIRDFCLEHGIPCIDPTAAMAAYCEGTGKPLYLPRGDMHWNREGHRAFFQGSREAFAALVQEGFRRVKQRDSGTIP